MAIEPRDYQVGAINSYFESVRVAKALEERENAFLCSPTGSGKTEIAMMLIEHLCKHGKTVNFLVERDSLKKQTSARFAKNMIPHGVLSGTENWGLDEPVRVISQQSARARELDLTQADLNVVDEGHIVHDYIARQVERGGRWLAMSATPFRKGLKELYGKVINVTTTDQLIREEWLVPLKVYCGVYAEPGSRNSSGEYVLSESAENVMLILPRILEEWEEKTEQHFGGPVKTIAFANTVADAQAAAKVFAEAGYDFHAVSHNTPQDEKDDLIEAHRSGEIMGLVSCEMLQRGYDVPDILCGIDMHHWRSLTPVVQQEGRGKRIFPGKEFCLWLDPAQNMLRHRDRLLEFWAEGCSDLEPRDKPTGEDNPDRKAGMCPECEAVLFGPVCRECGWKKPTPAPSGAGSVGTGTICVDGKLVPLDPGDSRKHVVKIGRSQYEIPPPAQGWLDLCSIAKDAGRPADKGQKWCQAQFRKFYGEFRMGRYDPEEHYPPASSVVYGAVEHSKRLFINSKKRDTKRSGRRRTTDYMDTWPAANRAIEEAGG